MKSAWLTHQIDVKWINIPTSYTLSKRIDSFLQLDLGLKRLMIGAL